MQESYKFHKNLSEYFLRHSELPVYGSIVVLKNLRRNQAYFCETEFLKHKIRFKALQGDAGYRFT